MALLLSAAAVSLLVSLVEELVLTMLDAMPEGSLGMDPQSVLDAVLGASLPALLVTAGAALVVLAVEAPFFIGRRGWYYRMAGGERENIITAFRVFSSPRRYFRALGFVALLVLKKLLWALLFIGPGVALSFFMGNVGPDSLFKFDLGQNSAQLIGWAGIAGTVMAVLGALLWLVVIQRYFAAPFIVASGSTVKEAFAGSVRCTRGRRAELFLFEFSFLGWWALCFFVLPMLYAEPYHSASSAIYARYLIEKSDRADG